jgi:hypothetical protein
LNLHTRGSRDCSIAGVEFIYSIAQPIKIVRCWLEDDDIANTSFLGVPSTSQYNTLSKNSSKGVSAITGTIYEPPSQNRDAFQHWDQMDALPNELLIQIASHLDTAPPSVTRFAHEPTSTLTWSEEKGTPLKDLSLASHRWREIALPILFHYVRIPLEEKPQWLHIDARMIDNMSLYLSKLSNHELRIYQRMRSKLKSSAFAFDETSDELLTNLCRIEEGDEFLKGVPNILWFPHLPTKAFADFARFVSTYALKHHIKSIVLYTNTEYKLRHDSTDTHLARVVAEIWSQIFLCLEPTRVVVAAPPTTLAGLLDVPMLSSDAWAFEMNMHYIELVQQNPSHIKHLSSACRPWDSALIHRRPWTHIGYNEGSSIAAYSTYEYHLKQSPKILYLTLLRLAGEVESCCNIRSFSFVGVFPFSTNIVYIIRALHRIPTLKDIQFQIAPGPENNLLGTPKRMGRAQPRDLWLEWNGSYRAIASFLGIFDFGDGSRFVSKDYVEPRVGKEVEEYIELLQSRGLGWRADGKGIWVRDRTLDHEMTASGVTVIVTDS